MFTPKSSKFFALSAVTFVIFGTSIFTPAQANTVKKATIAKAGRVVTPGINTLLSGKGAPKSTVGIDGDFYIDTNKMNIYGPKTKGKWPAAISLKGAPGTNGTNGTNGIAGATGPAGAKGTSTTGSDGAPGLAGATGSPGATGATGATGPAGTGSPGATGAAGSNGASGSNGTNGTNGAPGSIGETGSKGDTGNIGLTGPAGSSPATMGLLSFTTMIGNPSTSNKDFGVFAAGKSYVVQLLLHGVSETGLMKIIKFSVSSPDSTVVLTSDYVVQNGYTSRSGATEQESSIVATVLVNGANTTHDYFLTATITCNQLTETPGLIFNGSFSGVQINVVP